MARLMIPVFPAQDWAKDAVAVAWWGYFEGGAFCDAGASDTLAAKTPWVSTQNGSDASQQLVTESLHLDDDDMTE